MDSIIQYIKSKKNIKIIGQTSDCEDISHTIEMSREYVLLKHLKQVDTRYYISIVNDDDGYDISFDCNRGILETAYSIDCKSKDSMVKDLKVMLDEVDENDENLCIINFSIDNVNKLFLYFYQLSGIPIEEFPSVGCVHYNSL
jgi:hypothetical protein